MSPSNETTKAQHEKGRLDPDKIEAKILANEHFSSRSMSLLRPPNKASERMRNACAKKPRVA